MIIGADDKKFDETGIRVLHDVDYKIPSQSEITKWINSASTPSIAGLECELVPFQNVNLLIITIPPTFDLHETTREFNASGHFSKHAVFMRQDEHTVPASVRDGVTIQQRKHLYRQEIANPSSLRIGAIAGGIVGLIIGGSKINANINSPITDTVSQALFIILGILLGAMTGWVSKQWNETRYDFRYMTLRQKIISIIVVIILSLGSYLILR